MYPNTSYRREKQTPSAARSRPTRACCTRWPSRSSSSTSPPSSSSSRTSRPSSSSDTTPPYPRVSLYSSPFRRLLFVINRPITTHIQAPEISTLRCRCSPRRPTMPCNTFSPASTVLSTLPYTTFSLRATSTSSQMW